MRPLRIGLAGCGRLAEVGYLPAIETRSDIELAAVADPDPRRLDLAGAAVGRYADVEGMVAGGGLDALVVASPPVAHEHAATTAARAGLPALIEKPPAPDLTGAERIAALDPPPWIGFNRRFTLGAGLVGVMPPGGSVELELRYRRFAWAAVTVRDPALIDLAPHLVDLALVAGIGEPRAVSARSARPDRIELELDGARGSAALRCACDRFHRERAVVRAGDGSVVASSRSEGFVRGTVARVRGAPHPLVASLAAQLGELASAIGLNPAPTLATAADGVVVMRVLAAAAGSLAHGGERVQVGRGA